MLSLRTLGALELREDETPLLAGRRKPLALLACVLRRSPRPVAREELASMLWGRRGDDLARQSLRQALSELRGALGARLDSDGDTVRVAAPVAVDAAAFEDDVASSRWRDAIARWHGDFLPRAEDLGDDTWRAWLETERASLRRQLAFACDRQARLHEERAEWSAVIALAERWIEMLPLEEEGHRRLVTALRAAGRGAEALACHARALARLRQEGGIEPSPGFVALGETLLREPAASRDAVPGARALLSPDLVGRGSAFEVLSRAWAGVRHAGESGVAILLEADEGLGKTRLCQEFVRAARNRDQRGFVVYGSAFAAERRQAWTTARPLVLQLVDGPGLLGVSPGSLAALARIAPELLERFPHLPAAPPSLREVDAFREACIAISAEAPLLLVVDDAPDADVASSAVLGDLLRRMPPRMMLVLSGRPTAWATSSFGVDVARLGDRVRRLELAPLTIPETVRLLSSMAPLAPESAVELAERLHANAGGNPRHLISRLANLADRGVVVPDAAGPWRLARPIEPGDLATLAPAREAMQARLTRLSPRAGALAEAAAVSGPRVDLAVLELLSGLSAAEFQSALGELLMHRLLRASSSTASVVEFPSEADRHAVSDLLAPSRRRALQRAAREASRRHRVSTPVPVAVRGSERLPGRFLARHGRALLVAAMLVTGAAIAFVTWPRGRATTAAAPILLADIENLTGDSVFNRALYTAATVTLQESRQVSLFPRARVRATLRLMQRGDPDTFVGEALAREIAMREGLSRIVALSIARFDTTYQLTARLVEPTTGRDLYDDHERVPARSAVLSGLDRLLLRLRRSLGERGMPTTPVPALPRVTTSSLEALRAYADGLAAWARRDYAAAGDAFRRATGIDPGFALAWASLADFYFVEANDRARGDSSLDRALSLQQRLTAREQLALAIRAARYRGPRSEEVVLTGRLAREYPDRDSWYSYGTSLMAQRQCPAAIDALRKSLVFDSAFANAHVNLATCQQFLGRFADAVEEYARAAATDTTILLRGTLNLEWGNALLQTRGAAAAESAYRLMLRRPDPNDRGMGQRALGYLAMYQGRYHEALGHLDSAVALAREAGATISEWRDLGILADAAVTAGDTLRARAAARRLHAMTPGLSLNPGFLLPAGRVEARAGLLALANETARWSAAMAKPQLEKDRADDALLHALLLLHAGHAREALARLADARDTVFLPWIREVRITAYVTLGLRDSAIAVAREAIAGRYFGYEVQDEGQRAAFQLGELLRESGDRAGALRAYEQYLTRYAGGDSDLPEVAAARRAVKRVAGSDSAVTGRVGTRG